jgi:hypothetical protein
MLGAGRNATLPAPQLCAILLYKIAEVHICGLKQQAALTAVQGGGAAALAHRCPCAAAAACGALEGTRRLIYVMHLSGNTLGGAVAQKYVN